MISSTRLLCLACAGAIAPLSIAQLSVSGAGPFNSWGSPGDPNNYSVTFSNPATTAIYSNFSFTGTLNSVAAGTWVSDSNWTVTNNTLDGGFSLHGTGQTYTTTSVAVNNTGLFWFNNNDSLTLNTSENVDDDPGNDATWTNIAFNWSGSAAITNLGAYAHGTAFTFDTTGSDFDTVLGLYDSSGHLLGFNDDNLGASSATSLLSSGTLADGKYILVAGGFGGVFDNGVAVGGAANGNLITHVNGASVFNGAHAANSVEAFSFVVPEPASLATLSLGACALLRRRKK